jgi:hypothetical protein
VASGSTACRNRRAPALARHRQGAFDVQCLVVVLQVSVALGVVGVDAIDRDR